MVATEDQARVLVYPGVDKPAVRVDQTRHSASRRPHERWTSLLSFRLHGLIGSNKTSRLRELGHGLRISEQLSTPRSQEWPSGAVLR